MRRIYSFDLICLFFVLAAFFTVGLHLGGDKDASSYETILIELSLTVNKGKISEGDAPRIDGRCEADLVFLNESKAEIRVEAQRTSAGWLLSSGKYVSENQPLKFYSDTFYIEGRINRILEFK